MSFSEWNKVKLGDACLKIGSGVTPRGGDKVYQTTGVSLIRSQNVYDFTFDNNGLVFIDDEHAHKMKNVEVMSEDILLNITGDSVARCCIVPEKILPARVNQHVSIIRPKKEIINPKYLLYYLNNYATKEILLSLASAGATRKALTKSMIEKLILTIPSIKEQKAIADTLYCLDNKINLNNSINKTLEEMAQDIFKSWFVDFEPFQDGEFEDSELGRIPKGWKVVQLSEVLDVFNGYSYKSSDLKESKNAMVTIKNFDRNGGIKIDGFKEIEISDRVKDKHYVELFDVLVAHTDLTQNAEIIGNPILVLTKSKYEKLIASMDLVKVVTKVPELSNWIVYALLKHDRFKQHAQGYSSGTTVLHLNKKAIPEYKIALPADKQLLNEISFMLEPIYRTMSNNLNENQILIAIRDILLPKLMSGEIRVPIEEVQ